MNRPQSALVTLLTLGLLAACPTRPACAADSGQPDSHVARVITGKDRRPETDLSSDGVQMLRSLRVQPTFVKATRVTVDRSAFLHSVVDIDIDGHHLRYDKDGGTVTDKSNWYWTGHPENGIGDAVVTSYKDTLVAAFHCDGVLLRLQQTAADEYLLIEVDPSKETRPPG